MRRLLIRSGMLLALILFTVSSYAQVPMSAAETLLRKSGATAQFQDVSRQVKTAIEQSPLINQLPADTAKHLHLIAEDVYSYKRLMPTVQSAIASKMNKRDYLEALNWYDSGLGQRITGIEESVSSSMVDIGVSVEDGNEALSAATSERKALLARLIKTTKTNEFAVNSTINAALGVFRGVAGALPSGSAPKLQEFRAALEMQRPSLLQGFNEKSMALFALTYSKASDAELKQYEEFLASGAGSRWTKVMLDAMDSAYSQASQEFGKRIAMQMKPSTL